LYYEAKKEIPSIKSQILNLKALYWDLEFGS